MPVRRFLPHAWLFAVLLATALLAGCGNKGDLVHPPPADGAAAAR